MASIRNAKKSIRYTCGDAASQLLVAANFVKDFDKAMTAEIINDIAAMQVEALAKCSFSFDKVKGDFDNGKAYRKSRHEYVTKAFVRLNDELKQRMQSIANKMNAAMPEK